MIRQLTLPIACVVAALVLAVPGPAAAQTPTRLDLGSLSLEELLAIEVKGASRFLQDVREAAASITIVTAHDIQRHGHRTLADVLRSVRGFYTNYDRNYMYVGMRGVARPGDYNTRFLLLIDGHRLNDGVYDQAPVGTDFPIDLSLIERVEVIRGPASSLYGTNAFLGVINVVTVTGRMRQGVSVEVDGGSLGTARGSARYGALFGNGHEMIVGVSGYGSRGQSTLFYSEFAEGPSNGLARGLDDDRAASVYGSYRAGALLVHGAFGDRDKQVPTGSFGTAFGDDRSRTSDQRGFVDVSYDGRFGAGWSGVARAAFDRYAYRGDYPTDYGDPGVVVFEDGANVQTLTGELTARRSFGQRQLFTAGVEWRRQMNNHQWAGDAVNGPQLDLETPATGVGVYAQNEMRVAKWLIATGGLRLDRLPGYGHHLSPRVAIVALPRDGMSLKVLHGRAFRAPNAYEQHYYEAMRELSLRLEPERVVSNEVVWEQTFHGTFRLTASLFSNQVDGLIEQRRISDANSLYFANGAGMRGRGAELEIESRFDNGIVASIGQTYAHVRDSLSGARVSNSPRHLTKAAVQVPAGPVMASIEGAYVGSRLTLDGSQIGGSFVPNLTITSSLEQRWGFMLGIYNATDRRYGNPGAEEHAQQSLGQDGRTVLARVRLHF